MSEEKLYAIRNNVGKYLTIEHTAPWWDSQVGTAVRSIDVALAWAGKHGGHVVALIEEPEKVVISKTNALRQGWLVARYGRYNPDAVSDILARYKDEAWDMIEAYVNGYTLKKDKRYLVELDGLVTTDGAKQYLTKKDGKWFACRRMPGMHQDFTEEELNRAPEWAQQLDHVEVTDNEH